MDSEIPELHCHLPTVFCIGQTLKPSLVVKYSVLLPGVTLLWYIRPWSENTSQLIPFCLTTSIITEIRSLKKLIGSCADLNGDSGSGSNLKYCLWLLLQPKMQTPARVHSGSPAPWSSLVWGHFGRDIFVHKQLIMFVYLNQWFSTFFMQRPILQPNFTWRPLPENCSQANEMQLCLHNRKSQWPKITYDIIILNKDLFNKFMHMAASVRETHAV